MTYETSSTQPIINVVIAAWNAETTVVRAVKSALAQEEAEVQVTVVDDGSTDETAARVREMGDPRVTCIQQPNAGAAAARNAGWRTSTVEWVFFLDADDELLPGSFQAHLQTLCPGNQPRVAFSYGRYRCVDEAGKQIKLSAVPRLEGNILNMCLREEGWLIPSVCIFHRSILEETGGFDESLRYHEDRVFSLKVAQVYPAVPVPRITTNYTQSPAGKARRSISSYGEALENHHRLLAACSEFISNEEIKTLRTTLINSLCSRFLLYGYKDYALLLRRAEPFALHRSSLKGILTWLSLVTRINILGAMYQISRRLRSLWIRMSGLFSR